MSTQRYFNPAIELMERNEIKNLQKKLLPKMVEYVYGRSMFHRKIFDKVGLKPMDVKSLEDLKKIPVVCKTDLEKAVKDFDDPMGGRKCVEEKPVFTFAPEFPAEGEIIYVSLSFGDITRLAEALARQWIMVGVGMGETVQVQGWSWDPLHMIVNPQIFPPGLSVTTASLLNCKTIPVEVMPEDIGRTVFMAKFFKPSTVLMSRKTLDAMVKFVEKEGINPKDLGYRTVVVRESKNVLSADERKIFEEKLGLKIQSMLDVRENLFYASDCLNIDGLHVWEDMYIVEVLDPEKLESVGLGEYGKLTITNLFAEVVPLVKYRSDVDVTLNFEACGCGRTHVRIIPQNYK